MMNPDLITQYMIFSCIKCGKCVSSCPLTKSGEAYSPMIIIEKALLGYNILEDKETWLCLTCQACLRRCPAHVQLSAFIDAVRDTATRKKMTTQYLTCARCGQPFVTTPINEYIKKISKGLELSEEIMTLCPLCRKYTLLQKWRSPQYSLQHSIETFQLRRDCERERG